MDKRRGHLRANPEGRLVMNRTEFAQLLSGQIHGKLNNTIALMLNEVTDEQLKKFIEIYRRVNGGTK